MAKTRTISVPRETVLTLTTDEYARGRYVRISEPGNSVQYTPVSIGPNSTVEVGPFNDFRRYRIVSDVGEIAYTLSFEGLEGVTADAVVSALSNASLELVTPANSDEILIKDSSDGGKLKAMTVQSLVDFIASSASSSSSLTTTITQSSHGFSVGNVIALSSSGTYIKALSNDITTVEAVGIVSSVQNSNEFTLTTQGYITGLSGLTPGETYFVSDSSAGTIVNTKPYLPNTVIKAILIAETATTGYVQNYLGVHND